MNRPYIPYFVFLFLQLVSAWLSPNVLLSQQSIVVSEGVSLKNVIAFEMMPNLGNHTLLYLDKKHQLDIKAFNEKMSIDWEKELELPEKKFEVVGLVPGKEDFTLIYSYRQKQKLHLKAIKYDPGAKQIDSTTFLALGNVLNTPAFDYFISKNKEYILFMDVENNADIQLFVFDIKNMQLLWEKTVFIDDIYFSQDFKEVVFNNTGDAYLVFEKYNFKSKLNQHHVLIYPFGNSFVEGSPKFLKFDLPNFLSFDQKWDYDNLNNQLVCGGLYSENNLNWSEGTFIIRANIMLSVEPTITQQAFDEKFVSDVYSKLDPKEKGLDFGSIQEMVFRQDGGVLLIGERNRFFERGMNSNTAYSRYGTVRPIIDYFYEDLFISSIHPTGELHWRTVLPKRQYSQDDEAVYSSYFLAKTSQNLRIFFNDEIKNENTVSEFTLTANGGFDRKSLFSTGYKDLRIRFKDGIQTSGNEILVPSERRGKVKLVQIKF